MPPRPPLPAPAPVSLHNAFEEVQLVYGLQRLQWAPGPGLSPAPCLGLASPPPLPTVTDAAFCWAESGHCLACEAPGEGPGSRALELRLLLS